MAFEEIEECGLELFVRVVVESKIRDAVILTHRAGGAEDT